jgi:hypothetical protein
MCMHKFLLKNQYYHINTRTKYLQIANISMSGLQKTPRDDAVEMIFNLCLVESKHVIQAQINHYKQFLIHIIKNESFELFMNTLACLNIKRHQETML